MTHQERKLIESLRAGAEPVIGYGPNQQEAFRHGWNVAMERVWNALMASNPELPKELKSIGRQEA